MELSILYEDKQIIVCVKQPGLQCEEGERSLPALLRAHWGREKAYVGVVHRLDTATGGTMVYAKTPAAAADLSKQIAEGGLRKEYRCVCAGLPEPAAGRMEDWLFKDNQKKKTFPVKGPRKGAREALLDYELLEAQGETALCAVKPQTGRTHQIRVQFAARKHPLSGDGKYGSRIKGPLGLWCRSLTFCLPGGGEERTFTSPAPAEGPFSAFSLENL